MVGRVHLMFGLVGSGKSTLARELCRDGSAVRFTLDEWMVRLYPGTDIDDPTYGELAVEVKELIWSIAEQTLKTGTDVVLDWNSWSVDRRRWATTKAQSIGADVVLHKLTTSLEDSSRRAQQRTCQGQPYSHDVSWQGNEHLQRLLEEPAEAEGFSIVVH